MRACRQVIVFQVQYKNSMDLSHQQLGYETACREAAVLFAAAEPARLAVRCGATYDPATQMARVTYLGQPYDAHWPDGAVTKASGETAPLAVQVLILNYLLHARQLPTGELIAFREVPGAATYEEPFNKRSVNPFVKTFDNKPELLYAVAERLGGRAAGVGDASVTLDVLPLLPVTYAIWHSDEEFPATGTILFDASARRMLSIECLVVAAANGVYAMMGVARGM